MVEIREIAAKDIFALTNVISKIGVKEFKRILESDETKDAIAAATVNGKIDSSKFSAIGVTVAVNIATVIIENLSGAEDAIYKFVGGLTGLTRKQLENMPCAEFMEIIVGIVKQPGFRDFIGVASKLFSSEN